MSARPSSPSSESPSRGGWSLPGESSLPDTPDTPTAERYLPGSLLGRGGMGVVRVARDTAIGRDVALKELDPSLVADPQALARLAREAAITGRLDHPGIVAVHDVGRHADGRPFYVMRLVRGRSLAAAIAEATTADLRRALVRHVLAACEAVAAAHHAGIVHRDLKPSNILLGQHGETQVVDWGLAAPTPAAATAWEGLPGADAAGAVGTPEYMAPEAPGAPPDPRHDVYALGVILREVLGSDAPRELDAVISRALSPPTQRYPDGQALAVDLLAWFEGRRVVAHTYTASELLARLARTWKGPLLAGGVGLLAAAVAVLVGVWNTVQARQEAETLLVRIWVEQAVEAVGRHDRVRAERYAVNALLLGEDPVARGVLAAFGRATRPRLLATEPAPRCTWSAMAPDAAWLACGTDDAVSRWERGELRWTMRRGFAGGTFVSGGLAVWDNARHTSLLDLNTGAVRYEDSSPIHMWMSVKQPTHAFFDGSAWPAREIVPVPCEAIQVLAVDHRVAGLCTDGSLLVGPPDAPTTLHVATPLVDNQGPSALTWTPDGRLVAGSLRGALWLLDADTGQVLSKTQTPLGTIAEITTNGTLAAVSGTRGGVGLWDLGTGAWLGEVPVTGPRSFALRQDGSLLIYDGALRTWELPGHARTRVETPTGLADLAVASDGSKLVLAGAAGLVHVVGLPDAASALEYNVGAETVVKSADFSPDGGALAAILALSPKTVTIVDGAATPFVQGRAGRRMAWLSEALIGTDMFGGLLRWRDPAASLERISPETLYVDLEAEPDRSAAVVLDAYGGMTRIGAAGAPTPIGRIVGAREIASDRTQLAVTTDHALLVLDAAGRVRHRVEVEATLTDVALSPDGARVAAGAMDGRVFVWDTDDARLLAVLSGHTEQVSGLSFLPDGDLATASWDHSARLWDLSGLDRDVATLHAEILAAYGDALD